MSKDNGHKSESPLRKIKEKELELGGRYLEAKKQAEIIIAEARKNANEIKASAKENAIKEAELYYKQKLSLLNKDKNKFDDNSASIRNVAEKNFGKACEYLLKQIVPSV